MGLTITAAAAASLLGLGALFGWLGGRAPDPNRGPRMVPWRFLMLLCAAGVMMLLVHVATLAGLKTGR